MAANASIDDLAADHAILEAIGRNIDGLIDRFAANGAILKTLRQWFSGHAEPPEDEAAQAGLMAMAADLELFTPSMSGRTAIDRHLSNSRPQIGIERQALEAIGTAQFRLVRILRRQGPHMVCLNDLLTGESLQLLHSRIAPEAAGLSAAMRLCPLPSGRHVVISPLFALSETMLDAAMKFARPGRPLSHRCAVHLYREAARRGFMPIPQCFAAMDEATSLEDMREIEEDLTAVERLAVRWLTEGAAGDTAALVSEARHLACASNLIDACGLFGRPDSPKGMRAVFERIAELQMETLVQRMRASVGEGDDALDIAATAIAKHVGRGAMNRSSQELFQRLRLRWAHSASTGSAGSGENGLPADIDRVIQRIQALRAKTVDRGCTEAEAMAAAAKIAELLDRHDLTLDEISIRNSHCESAVMATGRKRRAAIDGCVPAVATFCDCRVWSEEGADGALRYVFFGLKADVEAARCLHELIEVTFETESASFRRGDIYAGMCSSHRRTALNSFQIGLASGISARLATLKAGRQAPRSNGFDLVVAKQSVVDEELARLGLHFTARTVRSRRAVLGDAYDAGKATGSLFEPHAALAG